MYYMSKKSCPILNILQLEPLFMYKQQYCAVFVKGGWDIEGGSPPPTRTGIYATIYNAGPQRVDKYINFASN